MNTETIQGNSTTVEVYTSKVMQLFDEYVQMNLDGYEEDFNNKKFMDVLYYIHDRLELPSVDDIKSIDKLFDSYVRLCARTNHLPTIFQFSIFSGFNRDTFSDWANGRSRKSNADYIRTAKRWYETCEGYLADSLVNDTSNPVGRIFSAKANFGWNDNLAEVKSIAETTHSVEELPTFDNERKTLGGI